MNSILNTTKELAGLTVEDTSFEKDVIMYINSVFLTLKQIGVGPAEGFVITDSSETWEEFIPENKFLRETTKAYMGSKVRLKFDPPTSSTLLDALKQDVAETEWRLNHEAEIG